MTHKALALFSGGLDSILSVMLIRKQGIAVEGITFSSVFYDIKTAQIEAKKINLPLHIIDFNKRILELIQNPKFGYGKNLNPCIDCHLWMIIETKKLMKKLNADFIITGEVVGERPKSQKYTAMNLIANKSETKETLLRPLSAKKLNPTKVEELGIVDRQQLLGITGRSRKPQIQLAKEFNITDFPTPAGGCLLTVSSFSDRLRVHFKLKRLDIEDIESLKYGRHFFTNNDSSKIIVGRDSQDNIQLLKSLRDNYILVFLDNWEGPVCIVKFYQDYDKHLIQKAGALCLRYSKWRDKPKKKIFFVEVKTEEESQMITKFYLADNFLEFFQKFNVQEFSASPKSHIELELKRI